jgi:hypothetical protein
MIAVAAQKSTNFACVVVMVNGKGNSFLVWCLLADGTGAMLTVE